MAPSFRRNVQAITDDDARTVVDGRPCCGPLCCRAPPIIGARLAGRQFDEVAVRPVAGVSEWPLWDRRPSALSGSVHVPTGQAAVRPEVGVTPRLPPLAILGPLGFWRCRPRFLRDCCSAYLDRPI